MSERVNKAWGWEEVIVNGPLYCGKILHLDRLACSSLHYHREKEETFYVLAGLVKLQINGSTELLGKGQSATIKPKSPHRFTGVLDSMIIEFSTEHREEDVVRMTASQGGHMSDTARELPRYRCHKEVWALKIAKIQINPVGEASVIHPEEPGYAPFLVSSEYVVKHNPQAGGYYVVYKDGYKSFSPAEAFEEGYTKIQ